MSCIDLAELIVALVHLGVYPPGGGTGAAEVIVSATEPATTVDEYFWYQPATGGAAGKWYAKTENTGGTNEWVRFIKGPPA